MQDLPAYNHLDYMQDCSVNSERHLNTLYAGLSCVSPLGLYTGQ